MLGHLLNDRRDGKAFTRFLSPGQLTRFRDWSENHKRFEEIVAEMLEISRHTEAILTEQERATAALPQQPKTKRAAQRRAARKS